MSTSEGALLARKTWRTLEPLHGMIYFVPEAAAAYERLGITGRTGYFGSRAAAMGPVTPEVVISTFFNFNPRLVRAAIPHAWAISTPAALLSARFEAVDGSFRRLLGEELIDSPQMHKAAELARSAAEVASTLVDGRPLCAAHAGLAWPDEAHLVLWHAQSILREFRGDGHIALLLTHGLNGIEALVTHGLSGDVPSRILQSTRGWSDDEWLAAVGALQAKGWLTGGDEPTLSEWGMAQRQEIEEQTDLLAAMPYAALGEPGCAELRALARPWSKVFSEVLRR